MLHEFIDVNRAELIARCRAKVVARGKSGLPVAELDHGIPMLLGQLITTLEAEADPGPPDASTQPDRAIARSAGAHGSELLRKGFTIDQVVHDYGDLCQALTELAG